MKDNEIVKTEYAVEINNKETSAFIRQVECFDTFEEADEYTKTHTDCADNEYYNIIFIDYSKDGDEIGFGTVC